MKYKIDRELVSSANAFSFLVATAILGKLVVKNGTSSA